MSAKLAVFVDGCFWHGCETHRAKSTTANREFWHDKILGNVQRDHDTDRRLKDLGWTVFRVWEHDNFADIAERIALLVEHRSRRRP